ncbi:hypothetical protein ACQ86N_25860 [Puia sp. P3]|uniref:hypothetical protein n=1 Tax=Puia sp. P3 TaxID=3423952 RepID=UPI003D6729BB
MLSVTPDIHLYNDPNTNYASSIAGRYYGNAPDKWIIVRHPRPKQTRVDLKNSPGIIAGLRRSQDVASVSPSSPSR